MTTYSVFFPIVPGISDKYKGCDPSYFIGYIFDETLENEEFTIKYTRINEYMGIMITSQSRDLIWSVQDQTDHGHVFLTTQDIQDFKDEGSWNNEDQDYYQYRCILEKLNEGLN